MITYTLKRSMRTRSMRLRVLPGGVVEVTAPWWTGGTIIEQFVARHADKVAEAMARMVHVKTLPVSGRRAYLKHKEDARDFVTERVRHWNQHYGFAYGRISIKDTKRAWGSCSGKNNLNFSYLLLFLPPHLSDYIVVHELCHLKEHNHSPHFWTLVAETVPDYKERRKALRKYMLA